MKTLKTLSLALAVAGALTQSLHANLITGTIDMSGTATLDSQLLGSATKATAFSAVTVGGTSNGSYTGTGGDSVTWSAFAWNPVSTPVSPLWKFTDAGTGYTYTFDLQNLWVVSQDNFFLNLRGNGYLNITGAGSPYEKTFGTWSFTISESSGGPHSDFKFTFANSQTAALPDGGATITLLGVGLLGLAGLRRKI